MAQRLDRGPVPAAFVASNITSLTLDGIRIHWETPTGDVAPERHALYVADAEQLTIRGFQGRQAMIDGKLAAIGLDQVRDVFIEGSKPDRGTAVFVGHIGDGQAELTLTGNDLRYVTKEIAIGAVYAAPPY